jgi:hypothetical protein
MKLEKEANGILGGNFCGGAEKTGAFWGTMS